MAQSGLLAFVIIIISLSIIATVISVTSAISGTAAAIVDENDTLAEE